MKFNFFTLDDNCMGRSVMTLFSLLIWLLFLLVISVSFVSEGVSFFYGEEVIRGLILFGVWNVIGYIILGIVYKKEQSKLKKDNAMSVANEL